MRRSTLNLDRFHLTLCLDWLGDFIVGNSEDALSPTQLCPLALQPSAHQPRLAEALVTVGKKEGSVWLSHAPGRPYGTKPVKGPWSMA